MNSEHDEKFFQEMKILLEMVDNEGTGTGNYISGVKRRSTKRVSNRKVKDRHKGSSRTDKEAGNGGS